MNPSILLTNHHTTLFAPTLKPAGIPPRLSSTRFRRHRYKISTVRATSSEQNSSSISASPSSIAVKADVFGEKRELKGVQSLVDAMSPPIRIAGSALIFAAAAAAGYGLGSRFGGSRNAGMGGAVALGAAGAGAAYALNSCVPEVAAANLHNYVAGCDDPWAVKMEDIEAIANRYGITKQNEAFNAELCDIYCRFVSAVLPPGSEDLKGSEVETIIQFKNSLGIDDPDAAAMHMEIGRRIFRQRLETGDRDADIEQRLAFQKLIYVSNLVFGEASGFLLPWKRVFKVTDSQMVNRRTQSARDQARRREMFLRLHRTYVRNPNHNLLEHLDAIERIIRGAGRNEHDFHRDEIVYHLHRTLSPYWRQFLERLEEMFEYQASPAVLILCLRDRWIINTEDTRSIDRPLGYEPNRRRPRSPPSIGHFPSVPAVDNRGFIIGEAVREDTEEDSEESPEYHPASYTEENRGHNRGENPEADRDESAGGNF